MRLDQPPYNPPPYLLIGVHPQVAIRVISGFSLKSLQNFKNINIMRQVEKFIEEDPVVLVAQYNNVKVYQSLLNATRLFICHREDVIISLYTTLTAIEIDESIVINKEAISEDVVLVNDVH